MAKYSSLLVSLIFLCFFTTKTAAQNLEAGFESKNLKDPAITETSTTITSTAALSATENFTFSAGKSVQLTPPFATENGAVFNAKIAGCGE